MSRNVTSPGAYRAGPFLLASLLAACGGSSVSPGRAPAALSAARATGCITPSAAAQTTALPAAGGVTGTISIGPFATASSTCVGVTLATGADATLTSGTTIALAARRRALAATVAPQALAQVELSNTTNVQLTWASVTLELPANAVPAGSYPATITTTVDLGDGQTTTSVANFTITVTTDGRAVVTGPSLSKALAVLTADTSGVLSIYPAGTVLPTQTPVPTESETPSASPSSSASASAAPTVRPSVAPTVKPTATPSAAPTSTANPVGFTADIAIEPSTCVQFPASGGTQQYTISVGASPPSGFTFVYGWIGIDGSSLTPPTETVSGYPDGQEYDGSPGNTATLTVGPAYGAGAGVNVELFIMAKAGPPYYGQIYPVDDSSGNPAVLSVPWDEGVTTCSASSAAARHRSR